MIIGISLTSVIVSWKEIFAIDRNGNITHYEVEYINILLSGVQINNTITVDSTVLMVNLTGNEAYAEYSVRVRAYTSVGVGPYSDAVMKATHKNGLGVVDKISIIV